MAKALFLILILVSNFSLAQMNNAFPYVGGLDSLEKDINMIFVEAHDSGRVYFVEISYVKKSKKIIPTVHGATQEDATKMLIISFFQQNITKWQRKNLKSKSVIIPLFIEPFNVDKRINPQLANLWLQASNISKTFDFQKCLLTKPFSITKSEIHIEIEK